MPICIDLDTDSHQKASTALLASLWIAFIFLHGLLADTVWTLLECKSNTMRGVLVSLLVEMRLLLVFTVAQTPDALQPF